MQEICKQYEIPLIIDEVVCGLGRTGTWFGYQQFGIEPDMVTMAKGVASGYAAISCTVTTEAVFDMFKDNADDPMSYFRDISTFGGCTGGPAAARCCASSKTKSCWRTVQRLASTCSTARRTGGAFPQGCSGKCAVRAFSRG